MGIDISVIDILGVDILGVDIPASTPQNNLKTNTNANALFCQINANANALFLQTS